MIRNGVTLLELLIALALVLAMAALVAPAMVERLDERAFENAAEVARQQLLLARAHAASTGQPVEVLFRSDPPRVIARPFEPDADRVQAFGAREPDDEPAFEETLPQPWAYRPLPEQMRCSRERPDELEPEGFALDPVLREAMRSQAQAPASLRLAVYMPDGSALLGEPVWLSDDGGRAMRLVINHWTGLPTLERVADITEPETPEEADEPQELDGTEPEAPQPAVEDEEPVEMADDEPVEEAPVPDEAPDTEPTEPDEDSEP